MVSIPQKQRVAGCKEHFGEVIDVEVPTSYYGILEFDSGVVGSVITSFDVYMAHLPTIEIYGTNGTIRVPDPNGFGGHVWMYTPEGGEREIPLEFDYTENSRALGLSEMAAALENDRLPRASYKQTLHVLEILTGFERAYKQGGFLELTSKYEREAPMKQDLPHGVL